MKDDKFFILNTPARGNTLMLGVFLYRSGALYEIQYSREMVNRQQRWYIKLSNQIMKGISLTEIHPKLIEGDSRYSYLKGNVDLYGFCQIAMSPGQYYPRIYRPLLIDSNNEYSRTVTSDFDEKADVYLPTEPELVVGAATQLAINVDQLEMLCHTIAPYKDHLGVYGHEIRDLLILTSTEVEAQLCGIYESVFQESDRLTMQDYFLLNSYLKLDQYEVSFRIYPWLGGFRPFAAWSTGKFQQLSWYAAYNEVKHNRERKFEKASLGNVLHAVAASAILAIAQYGSRNTYISKLWSDFFELMKSPQWNIDDFYCPPFVGEEWKPKSRIDYAS